MSHRLFAAIGALAIILAFMLLAQVTAVAQQKAPAAAPAVKQAPKTPVKPAAKPWTVPKTAWGDPDIQGVYTFSTPTPLERPNSQAHKDTLTEAELAKQAEQLTSGFKDEGNELCIGGRCRPRQEGDVGFYNNFWTSSEQGRLTGRTSLILEPENGRKPVLTEQAQKARDQLVKEAAERRVTIGSVQHTLYDSWTDHPAYTRCLARPMPRIGQSYNHGLEILQTPGTVVIHYESLHDVRIIPLDKSPHIDSSIRQWNGDSRGHWEGNTLVIDWTNFTDKQEFQGQPQGNMHFIERLTKVDANTIRYEVTVEDPTTWTAPWKFLTLWRGDDPVYRKAEDLYEYACHEGNYRMMEDSLLGTRAVKETGKQPESGSKK